MCVCYLLGEHADCIAPKRNYFNDPKAPRDLFSIASSFCVCALMQCQQASSGKRFCAFRIWFYFSLIFCTPSFCEFRFVIVFWPSDVAGAHLRHKHAYARDDVVFGLNALNALDRCRRLMHSAALQMIKCRLWCLGF